MLEYYKSKGFITIKAQMKLLKAASESSFGCCGLKIRAIDAIPIELREMYAEYIE
jgi:hypothetical protein